MTALVTGGAIVALPASAGAAGTDAPAAATDLKATVVDTDAVKLTWTNPDPLNFGKTVIRGKGGAAAPTNKDDGFAVTPDGSLLPSATASNLADPTPYSFSVFACSSAGECAAPATITVDSYKVTASVAKDRVAYADYVNITGKVTDALTGAPVEYTQLSAVAVYPNHEPELVAQDLSRTGGQFTLAVQPTQLAQFGVFTTSDATHLGGFAVTRTVHVFADTVLLPVKKKGTLGTTFSLVGGAGPVDRTLPVVLQEKVKGKWRTLLKQKPNKKGLTTFKVKPTTRGKHVYRVTRAATPGVGAGTSSQVTLTVT